MNFYDNHNHSNFSPDSKTPIRDLIQAALNNNLSGIAITDHYDIDAPNREDEFIFNPVLQQDTIDKTVRDLGLGNNSSGLGFTVLKGIEVGLQPKSLQKIKDFTSKYKFDTIIASIHFIDGLDPYYGSYYLDKSAHQAYSRLLEIMYQTATEYKDFDILGHFDYVARYSPYGPEDRNITLKEYGDYLEPILKFLSYEGKTFEINTKTYMNHKGYVPQLDTNILKRFKELGADALSMGSDSHDTSRVGENFEKFAAIAKNCGFRYLVYYKERKPQYYKID